MSVSSVTTCVASAYLPYRTNLSRRIFILCRNRTFRMQRFSVPPNAVGQLARSHREAVRTICITCAGNDLLPKPDAVIPRQVDAIVSDYSIHVIGSPFRGFASRRLKRVGFNFLDHRWTLIGQMMNATGARTRIPSGPTVALDMTRTAKDAT